jgi:integrase
MALTVKKVERLLRQGRPTKVTDGEVRGLMLVIESRTSAAWLLRYQRDHVVRHMGLGSARDLSLAAARELARRERERLAGGIDPLTLRKSERAAAAAAAARRLTFKEASERFFAAHEAGWSNERHRDEFLSSLRRYVYPHIGVLDVADIDKDAVLRVLEQKLKTGETFWVARAITADRTRNRVERILDWAEARGFRSAGTPNPARWRGFLDHLLPKPSRVSPVQNLRSLPYAEVPDLMAKLAADEGVAAMAARFVILTACRIGEALGATWGEVDLDKAEWSVPAERMKARRPHTVPLSPQAMALLDQLPREQGNVFLFISSKTVGKALTEITVTRALRHAGCDATLHGFRSSFSTWAHERSAFSDHVIELSLAHSVGTAVSRAYRRTNLPEQRRRLMEQWAKFCTAPVITAKADVVPMRRR